MDVNNLQEEMVKAGFGEEAVKPEAPEDKETSHNQGKETTVGCIKGKPPPHHKVKSHVKQKAIMWFEPNIHEPGDKKGIRTAEKIARGQREILPLTKEKFSSPRVEGRAQLVEFCWVRALHVLS